MNTYRTLQRASAVALALALIVVATVGSSTEATGPDRSSKINACQDTKIRHIDCVSAQFYEAYDPHTDTFSHPIQNGVMSKDSAVHVRSCDERLGERGLIVHEFGEWCFVSRNCVTGYH